MNNSNPPVKTEDAVEANNNIPNKIGPTQADQETPKIEPKIKAPKYTVKQTWKGFNPITNKVAYKFEFFRDGDPIKIADVPVPKMDKHSRPVIDKKGAFACGRS